jgi:hypothetical protein
MMTIGSLTLSPLLALAGVVVLALLVIGLFRFFLRLAWRLISIVLTLIIGAGIILVVLNFVHIK